ncbi:GTP 3',8-cyclase MoaA [bacterium]|nr:GTP 3',8-cyclase MoaA [bacterium]
MYKKKAVLTDTHQRQHNYLRISLTERCNLRCSYCMPLEGVQLSPAKHLMNANEIYSIAKIFVNLGVNKIRLTGGEPLVRKDFSRILERLSNLNVDLSITTNAVSIDRYLIQLKKARLETINVSLDTLDADKYQKITFRNYFNRVYQNILTLISEGFKVKINAVLMRGINEDEILNFIKLTKNLPIVFRFIEFMPFNGNQWRREKIISFNEIMRKIKKAYPSNEIIRTKDAPNDTSKNYSIKGYRGSFAIISTVTNPFCDTCNRIRLTADGKLKNCLFSKNESDLLTALRNKEDLEEIIAKNINNKFAVRSGMSSPQVFDDPKKHKHNRSMITIGG